MDVSPPPIERQLAQPLADPNIFSYLPEELEHIFASRYQEPAFRALQVFQWAYRPIAGFDEMNNVPKSLRSRLMEDFEFGLPEIIKTLVSDDKTEKYLLRYADGHIVEAVRIPYHRGDSLCISTQVGCKMACSFCASGRDGFIRHLTAGEIIGEIRAIERQIGQKITHIALMGTGEPLDNFDNVIKFLHIMHHPKGMNVSYRNISLSTSGLVPEIDRLADLNLPITLSISLHFPDNEMRSSMMPVNRRYPIEQLLEACKAYWKKTKNRVTFEYILLEGVNDSIAVADELIRITKPIFALINLIPYNATGGKLQKPQRDNVRRFKEYLIQNGLTVSIRRSAGEDIAAACGQLKRQFMGKECE